MKHGRSLAFSCFVVLVVVAVGANAQDCGAVTYLNAAFNATTAGTNTTGACLDGFLGSATGECASSGGEWVVASFNVSCVFQAQPSGGRVLDLHVVPGASDTTSVGLAWTADPAQPAPVYALYISTDGVYFSSLYPSTTNATSTVALGLTAGTLYYFQVFGADGTSPSQQDATGAQITGGVLCPATSTDNAVFNATAAGTDATGVCAFGFVGTATASCGPTGIWDTDSWAVACTFVTTPSGGRIAQLHPSYTDSDSVTLAWSIDTHNGATPAPVAIVVYGSFDGVSFTPLFAPLDGTATSAQVHNLDQVSLYYFQVFGASSVDAANAGNVDTMGAQITVTTTVAPPAQIVVMDVQYDSVTVTWTPSAGSSALYYFVSFSDSQQSSAANWTLAGIVTASAPSAFNVTGLLASTTYVVWVQASLDQLHPEPVGVQAIVQTSANPNGGSGGSLPGSTVAAIVVVVIVVMVALLIVLAVYYRRYRKEEKDLSELVESARSQQESRLEAIRQQQLQQHQPPQYVWSIPDVISFNRRDNYLEGENGEPVPGFANNDPNNTVFNTLLEVAVPAFLRLDYINDLRVERKLTQGGAGQIFEATLLDQRFIAKLGGNISTVALKRVSDRRSLTPEENRDRFMQEVSIMWGLSFHPNVIKLLGYTEEPRSIVTPLYKTDLYRYLHLDTAKQLQLDSGLLLHLSIGIISGIDLMHSMGLVHRDIKSSNILLHEPQAGGLYPHPVLCDFGLSRMGDDSGDGKNALIIEGFSPRYAAPEVIARAYMGTTQRAGSLDDDKYGDMYSVGVTFWEMFMREVPWSAYTNEEEISAAIRSGAKLLDLSPVRTVDPIRKHFIGLIDNLLSMTPVRRKASAVVKTELEALLI